MDPVRSSGGIHTLISVADPKADYERHRSLVDEAIRDCLEGGSYVLGSEVEAFEKEFAHYCGSTYAVGVNSGTDAIALALRALGIEQGDGVATVSHTALATVSAILSVNAVPVLVDVDPSTYTIDPDCLDRAMDGTVKAIVPVHLYGNPADLASIKEIGERWGAEVVEDCAQAVGAQYLERRVGSHGVMGCFSFYPTKNLGAIGDGGAVVTDDADLADRLRRIRQYGWDQERVAKEVGVNSRLDSLQAAILRAKLKVVDDDNSRRRSIAAAYSEAFAELGMHLPVATPGGAHVYHLYVVETSERQRFRDELLALGVQTAVHYDPPAHRQPGYANRVVLPHVGLPVTDALAERIVSLPLHCGLSDADVSAVIDAVSRTLLRWA